VVTRGNKSSAAAWVAYRGVARAENKLYRKANMDFKL